MPRDHRTSVNHRPVNSFREHFVFVGRPYRVAESIAANLAPRGGAFVTGQSHTVCYESRTKSRWRVFGRQARPLRMNAETSRRGSSRLRERAQPFPGKQKREQFPIPSPVRKIGRGDTPASPNKGRRLPVPSSSILRYNYMRIYYT